AGVDGLAALLGRFIAHPRAYYRLDNEGTLLSGGEGVDATYRLTEWELLSRMTFLLWGSPPTDALYDRTAQGALSTPAGVASMAKDLLADPRAETGVLGFYREWLPLDRTEMPGTDGNQAAFATLLTSAGLTMLPESHREDMIAEALDLLK